MAQQEPRTEECDTCKRTGEAEMYEGKGPCYTCRYMENVYWRRGLRDQRPLACWKRELRVMLCLLEVLQDLAERWADWYDEAGETVEMEDYIPPLVRMLATQSHVNSSQLEMELPYGTDPLNDGMTFFQNLRYLTLQAKLAEIDRAAGLLHDEDNPELADDEDNEDEPAVVESTGPRAA
jgi:hypothetical protein